jgi:hypothetical protein
MENTVEKTRQSWLRTHWKLVLIASLILSLCAVIAVFASLRNSDVVKMAIATAESNSSLAEQLGRPLVAGWFVTGTLEVTPASGHAELAIPVSGPKGKGTIYVDGRKRAGVWHLEMLQFGAEGSGQRLDLLAASGAVSPQN